LAAASTSLGTVDFEVREARAGEEERVLPMYEWLFAPPGSRPAGWDLERARRGLSELIASDDSALLVAEADGELVGFCTAYMTIDSTRFGRRCWVEELAVDPERRSLGIGAALLARAREWARERGATHLKLDSSVARTDAHRFYEREKPSWRAISYSWEL
jgi:GNAT superfamily N-acetyltransferase